jgi:hypothetical protein
MRYSRSRLRSSIVFSLTTLTFFCIITLHTLIWSTAQLELQEQISEPPPKQPVAIPFLSALDQADIYDLKATRSNKLHNHRPYITSNRIDELFQLIRNARNDQINSPDTTKSYPINSTWNFEKFFEQKLRTNNNDTNTHIDTADSEARKQTNIKRQLNFTTTEKTMNEYDKIQLRHFIHQALSNWKNNHKNDKSISLADIMHDGLAQDEPG